MALKGTNQEFGRPYNRRIVLETIRLQAPIARGEIARRVGLTVQTVSTIIRELEMQGFIVGVRETPKGRGYPPTVAHHQSRRRLCHRRACHAARPRGGADQSRRRGDRRARARAVAGRSPDTRLPRDRQAGGEPAQAAAARAHARHRPRHARPVRRRVHELRRPDHAGRLERRADRASGWPRRPACRPSSRSISPRRPWANGSMAPAATSATSITSISASASAAAWCMTACRCAAPSAMPARSAICRWFPMASPAPAAIAAASNATCRSKPMERRIDADRRGALDRRSGAAVSLRHRRRSRICSIPKRSSSAGLRRRIAAERPDRRRRSPCPIRSPNAAQPHARRASRCRRMGKDAVLRGAAALAVSGVLSPRFGIDVHRGRAPPHRAIRIRQARRRRA